MAKPMVDCLIGLGLGPGIVLIVSYTVALNHRSGVDYAVRQPPSSAVRLVQTIVRVDACACRDKGTAILWPKP